MKTYEHEIVKIKTLDNCRLLSLFSNGEYRLLDLHCLFDKYPQYKVLENEELFNKVKLSANYFVEWNDDLDLYGDNIFELSVPYEIDENPAIPLIGYQLKKIRLEKNITQMKLSKMTGIDQSDISRIENGCNNPSIEYLQKIATALHQRITIGLKEAN